MSSFNILSPKCENLNFLISHKLTKPVTITKKHGRIPNTDKYELEYYIISSDIDSDIDECKVFLRYDEYEKNRVAQDQEFQKILNSIKEIAALEAAY